MNIQDEILKLESVIKKLVNSIVYQNRSKKAFEITYDGLTFYVDLTSDEFTTPFISNIFHREGIDVSIFTTAFKESVENFDMKLVEDIQEENRKLKSIIKKMIVNGWVESWIEAPYGPYKTPSFQKVINYKFCNKMDLRYQCESENPTRDPAHALEIFYNYIISKGLEDLEKYYFS
jgi:hypothetical protein